MDGHFFSLSDSLYSFSKKSEPNLAIELSSSVALSSLICRFRFCTFSFGEAISEYNAKHGHRQTDRQRQTETDRSRDRTERGRGRGRERKREKEREREREREKKGGRETNRETDGRTVVSYCGVTSRSHWYHAILDQKWPPEDRGYSNKQWRFPASFYDDQNQ